MNGNCSTKMDQRKKKGEKAKRKLDEDGFEEWGGYMNAKIAKLEEQYEQDAKNVDSSEKLSNIFKGVAIFVNGYTEPSSEDLRLLMLLHGGTYHHYYRSKKTTHVIASNLPNAKLDLLNTMKVVKPEWIVKSIEAGKLLDYKNFLLFAKKSVFEAWKKDGNQQENPPEQPVVKQPNVAKTAVDPQFLSEFYSNSRLHHLSTMGAMFKQYVGELKDKHSGSFPGREKITTWLERGQKERYRIETSDRVIMHIDMDCFFVSVALRNHPELKGKPVAVAHARGNPTHERKGVDTKFEYEFYKKRMEQKMGVENAASSSESDDGEGERNRPWLSEFSSRSEVASCSYEARKAGVRNGMYLGSALKLCPDLKTVPYDFEGYKEVSYALYDTVAEYTLDIEAVSCDELFIDCTSLIRDVGIQPLDFATMLRGEIHELTRCPSSVGIGSNKLQARLATKRAKPNGQFYLQPFDVVRFMNDVDVFDLPGVGYSIGHKLKALDVKTCLDLQNIPLATLKKEFGGKTGDTLHKYCRGIDDRPVKSEHQRKSVSAEVNYGIRFTKEEEAITFLKQLSTEVSNRLKEVNMKGKNITFKVMIRAKDAPLEAAKFMGHGACDYTTRSSQLPVASSDPEIIARHVVQMYHQMSVPACELRGIGIQVTKLESSKQVAGTIQNFLKPKTTEEASPQPSTSRGVGHHQPRRRIEEAESYKLQLPNLSQVDTSVLESLPKELKLEILNEYGVTELNRPKKAKSPSLTPGIPSQIDPGILEELPLSVKQEIEEAMEEKKKKKPPPPSVFNKCSLQFMRDMITEWVAVEDEPNKFDMDLLAGYFCELVEKRQIERVDLLVKCLRRNVQDKRSHDHVWKKCYEEILVEMQLCMKKVFGRELFVEDVSFMTNSPDMWSLEGS